MLLKRERRLENEEEPVGGRLSYGRMDYGEREGLDSRVRNRVSQPCSRTMRSKSAAGGNPGAASVEARVTNWTQQGRH